MSDLLDELDRLDDPEPFAVTPALVESARARGGQLRRRHRVRLAAVALPVILLVAALGAALYVDHRAGEVHRVTVADGELTPVEDGRPMNILVVGTDGPRGQAGVRTDTIMVVHVDQAGGRVNVVSIPRDLVWDGSGQRIDTVLGQGGASALIEQIERHLGIPIAHFVEIDEPGLAALIDQVGGIRVDSATELRDPHVGLDLPAGCSTLDGASTVALARSRHLEKHDEATGTWLADPSSDLGREARQQALVGIVARTLLTMPVDSSSFSTLLDVFADHTTIDTSFSRSEMLDLARWGHGLNPDDLITVTPPVEPFVTPQGADVLLLKTGAAGLVQQMLGGSGPTPTTTPPGSFPSSIDWSHAYAITPC
jgi:polyisoprenyl-teichoic acid--peptidoglycan teichoic acid transferase